MHAEEVTILIFAMIVFTGAGLMMASMWTRRRMREMTHRERLAMIDRGLIPAADGDPLRYEPASRRPVVRYDAERGVRFRTAGVLLIGLGVGLVLLLTFTARQVEVAIGVGGSFVALGFASILNYILLRRPDDSYSQWQPPPPRGPEPPVNPPAGH